MILRLVCALPLCVLAPAASADLLVRFVEGAPKDRFEIAAGAGCAAGPATVTIDLSGSAGGLIFDVTAAGAGVEVFQPLEIVAGAEWMASVPIVADGDDRIELRFAAMPEAAPFVFTIDLDDTVGRRAITVDGAEIVGATVSVSKGGAFAEGAFTDRAEARVPLPDCLS